MIMANMSNKYMRMSCGYATVKTNFGLNVKTYVEVWSAFCCDLANIKVKITAPKGYRVAKVVCDIEDADTQGSFVCVPGCVRRGWNIDQDVQSACDRITFVVERIVDEPLGVVITSYRLGVISASVGRFVTYKEVVDAVNNYELDPVFSHDVVSGYLCTADEAEEALSMLCDEEGRFDFMDFKSDPLCVKIMRRS